MKNAKFLLLLALCLFGSLARADLVLSAGSGKGIMGAPGTPFERIVLVGYQKTFSNDVFIRPEVSYFFSGGRGQSSGWVSVPVGIRVLTKNGIEWHVAVGPSYLQNPDNILGGHVQFSPEACIGPNDGKAAIELCWNHLSSAWLYAINQGRDFIALQGRLLSF